MAKKALTVASIVLALVLWILVGTQPVHNPDIWYHLKTGEYISQSLTIPRQDFFSHTATGRDWIAQWWFYDIVVYQIQNRFGFNGLVFLKAVIALIIALIIIKTTRRFKVPLILTSFLITWGVLMIANAWVDRPHLFSYLLIVLLIDLLIAYRMGDRRSLVIIPPLLLLWANTHASVPLALALLAFALVSKIWHGMDQGLGFKRSFPRDLTLVSIGAALVSLLNPNGIRTHLYVMKINPEFVASNIVEWIPLNAFFEDYHIQLFLVFGSLSLLSYILVTKNNQSLPTNLRTDLFESLIFISLTYMAFSALRFAPVFILIMLPFTAKNLVGVQQLLQKKQLWPGFNLRLLPTAAVILFLITIIPVYEKKLEGSGLGVSFASLPAKVSSFLLTERPAPEIYHPFNWGGFMIWHIYPTYRVFIDGRLDMYVPDIYNDWLDVVRVNENWPEIFKRYQINTVTIGNVQKWVRLGQALETDPDWILVYWDDQAAVFVRDIPENQALIKKHALEAILAFNPKQPYRTGMAKEASQEYRRVLSSCPDCTSARNKLGVLYLTLNQIQLAKKYFRDAIKIDTTYSTAINNYALLLEKEGRYDDAIKLYQFSIQASPGHPHAYRRLGRILTERLQFHQEALDVYKNYLGVFPNAPDRNEVEKMIQDLKSYQESSKQAII